VDQSNIINLGLFVLTGVAVLLSAREANSAKKAREAADAANAAAAEHAKAALVAAERSASASEQAASEHVRIADAAERQAAVAESTASVPELWVFDALTDASIDQRWRVTNATGENVTSVTLGTPAGTDEQWIVPEDADLRDVANGESVYFTFIRRLSSPSTATVWVHWTPADGSAQKQFTKSI
jgi:hypothetical protein